MFNVVFDTQDKIVVIMEPPDPCTGVVEFDVQKDLYSNGKYQWLTDLSLNKFTFPIRTVGGDPISDVKQLGDTYFLKTPWKIRPYEETHVFSVLGNLYTEDGTSPFVPTLGNYNVTIINTVSNLVDSTIQQLPQIEYSTFDGGVTIDTSNGVSGTSYPIGTKQTPVNNLQDAITIAKSRGFKKLYFNNSFNFDSSVYIEDYELVGLKHHNTVLSFESGSVCKNCSITSCTVTGSTAGIIRFDDSLIRNFEFSDIISTSENIIIKNCILSDNITFSNNYLGLITIIDSWGEVNLSSSVLFDMNNVNAKLLINNFTGCLEFSNYSYNDGLISVNLISGGIKLNSSLIGGNIILRGIGTLINDSSRASVITDAFINKDLIAKTVEEEIGNEIQYSAYNNCVTLDVINGISGTSYPIGTGAMPVNNIDDALQIAKDRGFLTILITSDISIHSGVDLRYFTIKSDNWHVVTLEDNVLTDETIFEKVDIRGSLCGGWNVLYNCWVTDVHNFAGWLVGGSIDTLALAEWNDYSQGQTFIDNIVPMYPDFSSIIILNSSVNIAVTEYNGDCTIKNSKDGCFVDFGISRGTVTIDPTCEGGEIIIRGIGEVVNNSSLYIDTTSLVNTENLSESVWDKDISNSSDTSTAGYVLWNTAKKVVNKIIPFLFSK